MAIQFDLLRPDDLLNIRVRGINLRLDRSDRAKPVLRVEKRNRPAFLVFTFPPQTITEPAYYEASIVKQDPLDAAPDPDENKTGIDPALKNPGHGNGPIAMMGRPSRLVFKVPTELEIPFTIQGVLDWSGLGLSVNPIAAIGRDPTPEEIKNAPAIRELQRTETAIELPYRLIVSPTADVSWDHRPEPFTHRGRTELWHTRLQSGSGENVEELSRDNTASLRAVWSPDYKNVPEATEKDPDLGRTAMEPYDRYQIVILTSAFRGYVVDKEVTLGLKLPDLDLNLNAPPGGTLNDEVHESEAPEFVIEPIDRIGEHYLNKISRFKITVPYVPQPFEARQLMLSPLGGWLKSRGHWDPPRLAPPVKKPDLVVGDVIDNIVLDRDVIINPLSEETPRVSLFNPVDLIGDVFIPGKLLNNEQLDLSEWVHIATQGRDHYVRIVYEGELWPFRHRAALVKITERKFKEVNGIVAAYMIQRMFIVVREPEKTFDYRGSPFKKVRLTTLVTPDIAEPDVILPTNRSFWVEVLAAPGSPVLFQFHAVGTDVGGQDVDFTIPLMFVSISDLPIEANMKKVAQVYNAEDKITAREANIPGQKVMFAERNGDPQKATDNTQLVTESINFVVNADKSPAQMLKAAVKIPQVNELLGTDDATDIRFFKGYVDNGFDEKTGVFAEIAKFAAVYDADDPLGSIEEGKLGVDFNADQAGGIATPNMAVSTLTRELGPVAVKASEALTDSFDPEKFFGKNLAMLFGTFDLGEIITGGNGVDSLGKNAPHLTTKTEDIPGGKKVIVNLDWNPPVKSYDLTIAALETRDQTKLEILGRIEKEIKLNGSPASEPTFDMSGKLTKFDVTILKAVTVKFDEFSFESKSGSKTDVNVKLDPATPLTFAGDLEFVEELRKAIPPDLFGDGPSLDISATSVIAGFAFALPPIAVGVFALKDVNLGAELSLPFVDGKPVFDFNVSERQQPFLLAVSIFGGGGYFRLQLDTAGMKLLEASLEFGVTAALDLGVASGEVHVMAGIYFSLQRKEEDSADLAPVLSGYLRMGGSLSVLGLIKVSVEFNLSFTYDSGTEKAYGRATLTVHVEVLFFSKSVELTVERAFGGKSGDPKFGEMYDTAEKWNQYALAFA